MPDYNLLTTQAECDAATTEVDFELKTYTTRDANLDLADDRDERSKTSTAAQLAKVDGEIAALDYRMAQPGLSPAEAGDLADEREAFVVQRKKLLKRNRQAAGTVRFLADIDVDQVAAQVALLTQAKAGIATRRAQLPA